MRQVDTREVKNTSLAQFLMLILNLNLEMQNIENSNYDEFFSEILGMSKKNHKKFHFRSLVLCFKDVFQTNNKHIHVYFHRVSSSSFKFFEAMSNF